MVGTAKRRLFARPSNFAMTAVVSSACLVGVLAYPFVFQAFGPHDSPFEKPVELAWIALFASGAVPILVALVFLRRALLIFAASFGSVGRLVVLRRWRLGHL